MALRDGPLRPMAGFCSAAELRTQLEAIGRDGDGYSSSQVRRAYELAHQMAPPRGSALPPPAQVHLIYNPNGRPHNEDAHLWILLEPQRVPPLWLQHMRDAGSSEARVSLGISVFDRDLAQLAAGAPVDAMVELMEPQMHDSRMLLRGGKRRVRLCEGTEVTASSDPEDALHLFLRLQPLAGALGFRRGDAFGLRLLWQRRRPLLPKDDCMARNGRYGPTVRYRDDGDAHNGYRVQFVNFPLSEQVLRG